MAEKERAKSRVAFELGALLFALIDMILSAMAGIEEGKGLAEVGGRSLSPLIIAAIVFLIYRLFYWAQTPSATAKILCVTFAAMFPLTVARWNEAKSKNTSAAAAEVDHR